MPDLRACATSTSVLNAALPLTVASFGLPPGGVPDLDAI
jgi:hypothetical protein